MREMLPHEIFEEIFNKWVRHCSSFVGCHVLDRNYHVSLITIVVCLYTSIGFISGFYTIITFDVDLGLQCIVQFCIIGQLVMKCFSFVHNRDLIVRQKRSIDELYIKNNLASCTVLVKCSVNSSRLYKALLTLYSFSGIGFLFWTIGEYLISDGDQIPYFSQLPGIDSTKTRGFLVMVAFHALLTTMSSLGMSAVDGTVAVFTFNIMAFSGLIKNQMKQLNAMLAEGNATKSSQIVRFKFRNIIMMHKEMIQYLDQVDESFMLINFLQLMCSSGGMVVLIFAIFWIDWMQAYFFLACGIFQTFITCVLGTIVELANDDVYATLVHIKWNLLPVSYQREYSLVVGQAQTPKALTAGGVLPLNMTTMVLIMRKIYGLTMMLYRLTN